MDKGAREPYPGRDCGSGGEVLSSAPSDSRIPGRAYSDDALVFEKAGGIDC